MTSVTPFQPASTRPPAPTSAEDPVPLWNPMPSFFLRCPCLPWLNSVEYWALNPQLPVFLAKKWGEIHPSGGDPESRSSPGLPLDDTSVSARSGSSCRPDSLVERGLGPHPVLLGEGWSSRHASHVVPPPQPRTPCAPSPAVRTLLPCSGSPWTPGQAGAWLSSRRPWWPLRCCLPAPSGLFPLPTPPPPRCPVPVGNCLFCQGRSFVFRLSLSSEPRRQVPVSTARVRIPGCQGAGRAEGGWEAQPGEVAAHSPRPRQVPSSSSLPRPACSPTSSPPPTPSPSPSGLCPPSTRPLPRLSPSPPSPAHCAPLRSRCSALRGALPWGKRRRPWGARRPRAALETLGLREAGREMRGPRLRGRRRAERPNPPPRGRPPGREGPPRSGGAGAPAWAGPACGPGAPPAPGARGGAGADPHSQQSGRGGGRARADPPGAAGRLRTLGPRRGPACTLRLRGLRARGLRHDHGADAGRRPPLLHLRGPGPGPPASLSLKTPEPRQLQSQPCALSPPALSGLNPEPERSPAGPPAHVCFPKTSRTEGRGRGAQDTPLSGEELWAALPSQRGRSQDARVPGGLRKVASGFPSEDRGGC